ncbi:uncharacterized protein LOC125374635 [Haliotis rufescens]|nr:uncharacterized protein LOC125374635 [Haliotis rufescens]
MVSNVSDVTARRARRESDATRRESVTARRESDNTRR